MKEKKDTSCKTQEIGETGKTEGRRGRTGRTGRTGWTFLETWTYNGYPIRVLPDLVEALDYIAGMKPGELYDCEDCPECIAMIKKAKAALRKARGEE